MAKKSRDKKNQEQSQEEQVLENDFVQDTEAKVVDMKKEQEVLDNEELVDVEVTEEEVANPESEVDTLRKQLALCQDQLLRSQAEFQNFRKRKEKEFSDSIRFANGELLLKLLPILDNFARTLDAIEKTDNLAAIKEGITLVDQSMKKQFEKFGLRPIESIGKEFDIDLHEAISSIPIDDETKKGKVIDEVEKGYKLKDKVLRFSKVIIGE